MSEFEKICLKKCIYKLKGTYNAITAIFWKKNPIVIQMCIFFFLFVASRHQKCMVKFKVKIDDFSLNVNQLVDVKPVENYSDHLVGGLV